MKPLFQTFIVFCSILFLTACNNQPSTEPLVPVESKLQGEWVSNDDPQSMIVFQANEKKNLYNKEILSSAMFEILEENKLIVHDEHGDMEYSIISISDNELSLIYLPRGNTLKYKKLR